MSGHRTLPAPDEAGEDSAASRVVFGVAVLAAVVSAAAMAVDGRWEPAIRFLVVAALMLVARAGEVPTPFAAAFAALLLLATWASVQHWYRSITEFDTLVHLLTPGSLAAVAYFVLVRARFLPEPTSPPTGTRGAAPIVWVAMVGVTAAVVWEFYEVVLEQIAPGSMVVGYVDTVVDLLAGLIGSLVAGALVWQWGRRDDTARRQPTSR